MVLGNKRLSELGKMLTYEHLALDFRKFYIPPAKHIKHFPTENSLSLQNVGYIHQYPYSSLYNLEFYDGDAVKAVYKDVKLLFKDAGGRTIVENSNHGLERDISLMKNVSRNVGVNVIAGTGHYVACTQNASTLNMTKEEMYNLICKELQEGCMECLDVKAGFIEEVGSIWPIEDMHVIDLNKLNISRNYQETR